MSPQPVAASQNESDSQFSSFTFDQKLDRLAEVAIRVGLGFKAGQELFMTAPTDALPLVRKITEQAYKAGAKLVTTFFADDVLTLARYHNTILAFLTVF